MSDLKCDDFNCEIIPPAFSELPKCTSCYKVYNLSKGSTSLTVLAVTLSEDIAVCD